MFSNALLPLLVLPLAALASGFNFKKHFATLGSGNVVTEKRAVADFTSIVSGTSIDVTVTKGDASSLSIEGDDNIIPLITTEVVDGTLTIGVEPMTWFHTTRRMHITINAKELVEMRASASGNAEVGGFSGETFKMVASASGNVEMSGFSGETFTAVVSASGRLRIHNLQVKALDARISASGDLTVVGSAEWLQVNVSASGSFNGEDFKAQTVAAKATASGNINVWAVEAITASTSASGSVRYYGNPSVVKCHSSASGKVFNKGSK